MNFLGKDLRGAPQIRRSTSMRVEEVMSRDVITVAQGTSLSEAAGLMTTHRVSGLPVVDVEGRLAGILTESDFLSALDVEAGPSVQDLFETIIRKRRSRKKMGTIVDDIMTPAPITISKDSTLQRAVQLMDKNRVKRLVVADADKRIEGVVSRADLIKLFSMH